jgi:hypothetical protein
MTHPLLFMALEGVGEIVGAKFVATLIKLTEEAHTMNEDKVQESVDGCHLPLTYI